MDLPHPTTGPELVLDISPLSLEVYVAGVTGITSGTELKYQGTATLEVSPKSIQLKPRKSGKLLILSLKEPFGARWGEIREIKNELRRKNRRFKAHFGKDKNGREIIVWITPTGKDKDKAGELAGVLEKLPPDISGKRCPVCSGLVINNICNSCGRNFKTIQRKQGLGWLAGGILLIIVGWVQTVNSEKTTSTGTSITIYIGLLLLGLTLSVIGLIKMISGKR